MVRVEGDGKTMRHIKFASLGDVERPFVRRYIQAAMEQAAPVGARGTGKSLVKTRNAPVKKRTTRRKPTVKENASPAKKRAVVSNPRARHDLR